MGTCLPGDFVQKNLLLEVRPSVGAVGKVGILAQKEEHIFSLTKGKMFEGSVVDP